MIQGVYGAVKISVENIWRIYCVVNYKYFLFCLSAVCFRVKDKGARMYRFKLTLSAISQYGALMGMPDSVFRLR